MGSEFCNTCDTIFLQMESSRSELCSYVR